MNSNNTLSMMGEPVIGKWPSDWMKTCSTVQYLDTVWNVYFASIHMAWRNTFGKKCSKISNGKHFATTKRVENDEISQQSSIPLDVFRAIVWFREVLGFSQIFPTKNQDQPETGGNFEKLQTSGGFSCWWCFVSPAILSDKIRNQSRKKRNYFTCANVCLLDCRCAGSRCSCSSQRSCRRRAQQWYNSSR